MRSGELRIPREEGFRGVQLCSQVCILSKRNTRLTDLFCFPFPRNLVLYNQNLDFDCARGLGKLYLLLPIICLIGITPLWGSSLEYK